MKTLTLALLILTLLSCGDEYYTSPEPNFTTEYGIKVYTESGNVSQSDVELSTYDTVKVFSALLKVDMDNVRDALRKSKAQLHLTTGDVNCGNADNPDRTCGGVTMFDPSPWMKVHLENCFGKTAYPHELLHTLGKLILGDPEGNHDGILFKGDYAVVRYVEWQSYHDLCE